MIKTSKVIRRKLHFKTIEDLFEELNRIESADRTGSIKSVGNWTVGQILSHLSAWIEYGWDGYPIGAPPFFIKWFLVRMCKGILRDGMKPGTRIPGVEGGTIGQELAPTEQALARLRSALTRLQQGEVAKFESPAFGPLSNDDRIQLNLRHAELHLSFLQIE